MIFSLTPLSVYAADRSVTPKYDFSSVDDINIYDTYEKRETATGISYVRVGKQHFYDWNNPSAFESARYGSFLRNNEETQFFEIGNAPFSSQLDLNILTIYADPEVKFSMTDYYGNFVVDSEGNYRNVFSVTPRSKVKLVAKMLKAIHAQESKKAAREKAKAVVEQLRSMKLKEAAKKVEDGIEETLTYCDFPSEHWTRIRTNNVIERLNREIRRRTRVVGSFPDGNSALMLVCARLRHVAGTQWGNKKYMNMKHLEAALEDASIAG